MLQLKSGPNTIDGVISVILGGVESLTSLITILKERSFAHETIKSWVGLPAKCQYWVGWCLVGC